MNFWLAIERMTLMIAYPIAALMKILTIDISTKSRTGTILHNIGLIMHIRIADLTLSSLIQMNIVGFCIHSPSVEFTACILIFRRGLVRSIRKANLVLLSFRNINFQCFRINSPCFCSIICMLYKVF